MSISQFRVAAILIMLLCAACGVSDKSGTTEARSTDRPVGGGCENCELIYEGMPQTMRSADTAPDWNEPGPKLRINGTVFQSDAKTPAADVIVYYYHTDQQGLYAKRSAADPVHGYIRGWVKTGADGRYAIYTNRPAPYPDSSMPAHVHVIIKEPGVQEYYIDELVFDDDPLLTTEERQRLENRGGSGIMRTTSEGAMQIAEHDIVLGLNVPGYGR